MRTPAPFVDEAWLGSRAWSWLQHGTPLGSLDYGLVNHFRGGEWFYPFLPVVLQAIALDGGQQSPSLWRLRVLSLASGFSLVFAIWVTLYWWSGWRGALFGAALVALSGPFFYSAHMARYDTMAAAAAYLGVACSVIETPYRRGTVFIGGFCAGIATELHPFSIVIAAAIPALLFQEFGRGILSASVSRRALGGLLIGLSVYPLIHIVPNPSTYFALSRIVFGRTHLPDASALASGFADTAGLALDGMTWAWPVALWAVLQLWTSAHTCDRRLALLTSTICVSFAALVRNKLPYYAILFAPALLACIAAAIARGFGDRVTGWRRLLLTAACVMALVPAACFSEHAVRSSGTAQFEAVSNRLVRTIRSDETIMGPQTYWFALSHHTYYSWEQLIYLQRLNPGVSLTAAMESMAPDVFIRDGHLDQFVSDAPGPFLLSQQLRLPPAEFERWLATRCTLADEFDGGSYGRIRVYRVSRSAAR